MYYAIQSHSAIFNLIIFTHIATVSEVRAAALSVGRFPPDNIVHNLRRLPDL